MKQDIADLRAEMNQEIAETRSEARQANSGVRSDIDSLNGRVNMLAWMVDTNITLTLIVLGKLLLVH